jgi:O-antigen/teichoic acid export membrane protein
MLLKFVGAIATRGVSASLSLLSTSFIAHELGRQDLGIYLALLGLGQIVAAGVMFGLDVTPAYVVRTNTRHSERLYWVFTVLSLIAAGVGILIYIPASFVASASGNSMSIAPLLYAATTVLMTVQVVLLQGLGRFSASQAMQIAFPACFLAASFGYKLLYGGLTENIAVLIWSVSGGTCAVVGVVFGATFASRSLLGGRAEPKSADMSGMAVARKAFSYGAAVYVGGLISTLNVRLPALLAPLVIGESYGGYFAGVLFLHDVFGFFSFAIVSITMSSLAGVENGPARDEIVARACRFNTFLTVAAVGGLFITFSVAIPFLLGREFANQKFFLMMLALAPLTVIYSTVRIICTDFAAQGRPGVNVWLNVISIVTLCIMFPVAGRIMGEWGALLSFSCATTVFSIGALFVYTRATTPKVWDYFVPNIEEVQSASRSGMAFARAAGKTLGRLGR